VRASQNALGGSSQLSMTINKTEKGTYQATSPSMPWAKPIEAGSVAEAAQALRQAYENWVISGCRNGAAPQS
jgi:hypothetical protein